MNVIRLRLNKGTYLGGIGTLLIPKNCMENQHEGPNIAISFNLIGANNGFQRSQECWQEERVFPERKKRGSWEVALGRWLWAEVAWADSDLQSQEIAMAQVQKDKNEGE